MRLTFLALTAFLLAAFVTPWPPYEPIDAPIALTLGVEQEVTLTTSVQRITGVVGANWLELFEPTVDVYVVDDPTAVDGETALPATGRPKYSKDVPYWSIYIGNASRIGLAGSGAGTVRVRFRYIP